ncbi:single-stranded-DNA-specific exonuclease RecJ [Bacillus safensis FO-36b] [Bacillus safensis subsp. safensis]
MKKRKPKTIEDLSYIVNLSLQQAWLWLNEQAFRYIKEQGASLVITVDTGIAAVNEARIAKEIGLDLIITDHHEPSEELPEALAIADSEAAWL